MRCILFVWNYFFWDGFIGFSRLPKESAGRCVGKDPCLRHRVGEAGTVPLLTRDARGQLARGSRTRSRVCARTEILLLISTMLPPVQPSLTHSGSMSFVLMGIICLSRPTHTSLVLNSLRIMIITITLVYWVPDTSHVLYHQDSPQSHEVSVII